MASRKEARTRAEVAEADGSRRVVAPVGRDGWALKELVAVGDRGLTTLERPAPRWSAYVFDLRHEWGLDIVTLEEEHGGDFPGRHGRYVLRSKVTLLDRRGG